jgi:hypothetical protein
MLQCKQNQQVARRNPARSQIVSCRRCEAMFVMLQIVTVVLTALAMATALAHALEMPGKMRLAKEHYFAVQPIYYPGFTIAGFAEVAAIFAAAALAVASFGRPDFVLVVAAAIGLVAMQAIYWTVTHPVNSVWLQKTKLKGGGKTFFSIGKSVVDGDWTTLRNRWEYSHVARAVVSVIAFILQVIALAIT